ncbi:MAG TPA: T9SS type A sorting domain-containing protein, partial [Chryseosolibacter sp.]
TNNASANAFNANSGTLLLNGTSDQAITGSIVLNNITCTNSGTNGVGIGGNVSLVGVLTLTSGRFDADGPSGSGVFTVRSTGLGSGGRIAAIGAPNNFTGNVTVERYINAPEDYRYLAIPVVGANAGMLQDDIAVTGNFSNPTTSAQNANVVNQTSASVFTFNGATQAFVEVGSGAATGSTSLSNTTAYVAWTYLSSDAVVDFTGTIGKGNISISGLASNQYNLVPNPYPSAIDWDLITTTGFSNSMYMTTGQGSFATYTKGGGFGVNHPNNDWGGEIALGQSFYVQSTGGTSLSLTESAKTGTYDFVRENEAIDYFKVKLTGHNANATLVSDELGIAFRDGSTLGVDELFDAPKRSNPSYIPNFSSFIGSAGQDLAINAIPKIQCNQVIKLKMNQVANGEHTISFSHLDRLKLGYKIVLKDNLTGIEKNIEEGVTHTFSVNSGDPATLADGRFELRIGSPVVDPTFNFGLSSTYQCNEDFVKVNFESSQLGVKYLFKLGDENLHEPVQAQGANDIVLIPKSKLQYGANQLTLVASSVDACNAYIYNQAVTVNYYELNQITSVVPASACEKGALTLTAAGAQSNGSYRWYETENAVEPIAGQSSSSFTTPMLEATKTYYVSAVNSNGCESLTRTPVTATISSKSEISSVVPSSVCGQGQVTLQASGAPSTGAYRWYETQEGGNPIADAVGARFTTPVLSQSKTYYVSAITASGCESDVRKPVTATVNAVPAPVITANGFEVSVNANGDQVQWYKDGIAIEGATESGFSVKESGVYSVKLSNANGCSTTSADMEFIVLGVEENYSKHGFKVYPNPTEGVLMIEGTDIGNADVRVWDLSGKTVDASAISRQSATTVKADITKYPRGAYVVSIKKKDTVIQFKAIKK